MAWWVVKPRACVPNDVVYVMASFNVTLVKWFGDVAVFYTLGSELYS